MHGFSHYRAVFFCENVSIPPPFNLLKVLLGAGFTKHVCKIQIAEELEVKIQRTGDLRPVLFRLD
jgi:hypothetical protein